MRWPGATSSVPLRDEGMRVRRLLDGACSVKERELHRQSTASGV
ncbi:hypothetical protein [Actinocorallia libanotica]